jgi:hypothetical protein
LSRTPEQLRSRLDARQKARADELEAAIDRAMDNGWDGGVFGHVFREEIEWMLRDELRSRYPAWELDFRTEPGDQNKERCYKTTISFTPCSPLDRQKRKYGEPLKPGTEFGRLKVVRDVGSQRVECQCSCGNTWVGPRANLGRGNRSCGCWSRELAASRLRERETKHGCSRHPLYRTWKNMVLRCTDKNKHDFHNYGGRGIGVCDEWLSDPRAFIQWAEDNGWEKGLTLERKENDGNYEPDNCRWATMAEQHRNKRSTKIIEIDGERLIATDWEKISGVCHKNISRRLRSGWSPRDAVWAPVKSNSSVNR